MKYQVSIQKFPKKLTFFTLFAYFVASGLVPAQSQSDQPVDYQMQVEYVGKVTPQETPENPEPESLPLKVTGQFVFAQQELQNRQAVRTYRQASAKILLNEVESKSELSPKNQRLTVRLIDKKFARPIQYQPAGGLLNQMELDLLLVPADPLSFPELMANRKTSVGESWTPTDQALRAFLAAENVIENNVKIAIKDSSEGTSKLYITGDAKAEIDGAISRFQLIGLALLDEASQRIKGLRITIDEKRTASQLTPAFEGQVKVDVRLITSAEAKQIASQTAPANAAAPVRLLWSTDSEFELVYDPRWKIILSDQEAVIMRYADQGNLLAQCSILQLPRRPVDKPLTLDDFRQEIEKLLTESTSRLTSANTYSTNNGLIAHKIVVSGVQDEVAIDWVYYHVASSDGRRLAMIFTVETEVNKTFGAADQRLLEAVRFVPLKTASTSSAEATK